MTTAASDLKKKKTDRATYCLGALYFEAREFEQEPLRIKKLTFNRLQCEITYHPIFRSSYSLSIHSQYLYILGPSNVAAKLDVLNNRCSIQSFSLYIIDCRHVCKIMRDLGKATKKHVEGAVCSCLMWYSPWEVRWSSPPHFTLYFISLTTVLLRTPITQMIFFNHGTIIDFAK